MDPDQGQWTNPNMTFDRVLHCLEHSRLTEINNLKSQDSLCGQSGPSRELKKPRRRRRGQRRLKNELMYIPPTTFAVP